MYVRVKGRNAPRKLEVQEAKIPGAAAAPGLEKKERRGKEQRQGKEQRGNSPPLLLKFQAVDSDEAALKYKGADIFVREDLAMRVDDDSVTASVDDDDRGDGGDGFFTGELVGLDVFSSSATPSSTRLGKVVAVVLRDDINPSGIGSDLLEVGLFEEGGVAETYTKTVYVPFVKEIVVDVKRGEKGGVFIDPPPGLLDLAVPVKAPKVRIKGFLSPSSDDSL